MANLTLVKRDGKLVERLSNEKVTMKAVCQISKIDVKTNFTNVAVQKIYFIYNNIEYYFDHVWLQGRDYENCEALADVQPGEWVEIEFTLYPYRDKITKNRKGRKMHGLTLMNFTHLNRKEAEEKYGFKFTGIKGESFVRFGLDTSMWLGK